MEIVPVGVPTAPGSTMIWATRGAFLGRSGRGYDRQCLHGGEVAIAHLRGPADVHSLLETSKGEAWIAGARREYSVGVDSQGPIELNDAEPVALDANDLSFERLPFGH